MTAILVNLKKKGLRVKLIATFMFMLIIIGFAGGSGLLFVSRIQTKVETLSDVVSPLRNGSRALVDIMRESHIITLTLLTSKDKAAILNQSDRMEALRAEFTANLAQLGELINTNEIEMELGKVRQTQHEFFQQAEMALQAHLLMLDKEDVIKQHLDTFSEKRQSLDQSLANLVNVTQAQVKSKENKVRTLVQLGKATLRGVQVIVSELFRNDMPMIDGGGKLRGYLIEMQELSKTYHAEHDPEKLSAFTERFQKIAKNFEMQLQALRPRLLATDKKTLYENIERDSRELFAIVLGAQGLFALHQEYLTLDGEIKANSSALLVSSQNFSSDLNALFAVSTNLDEQVQKTTHDSVRQSLVLIALIIVIGMITAVLSAFFVLRTIIRSLDTVIATADKIAEGKLNIVIQAQGKDEIGQLMAAMQRMVDALQEKTILSEKIAKGELSTEVVLASREDGLGHALQNMVEDLRLKARHAGQIANGDLSQAVTLSSDQDVLGIALNEMTNNLNHLLSQVSEIAGQLKSGSARISSSSQKVSQGASDQASSLEEISSSMEELEGQAKSNAENAQVASQKAGDVKRQAESGNNQMQSMLKAMKEISSVSEKVSTIIKTIDEIAFQTNVLAINAAVEAARAGEHGKGFAVVAEEVRNLAQRSADASKETSDLIVNAIKKIEAGEKIAHNTARSLGEIVDGTTQATSLIDNIVIGSKEQSMGIQQINQGLNQLNAIVQANVTIAELTAAISQEMDQQTDSLKNLTTRFQLQQSAIREHSDQPLPYQTPVKQLT